MSDITPPVVTAPTALTLPTMPSGTTPPVITATDWTSGFSDELKGYVQSKGFKDSSSVVESYRNYEKLQGVPQDRLLRLPEKPDDPAWEAIHSKLGKPAQASEYKLEVPKDMDPKIADWAKETFHKLNIPRQQAETLFKEFMGREASIQQEMTQQKNAMIEQQTTALKREWGQAFDQNVEMGRRAAQAFGFDAKTVDALESALGFSGVMKFMHNLQTKVGEDGFVGASQGSNSFKGILAPDQARGRIAMLKGDPDFTRRYLANESGPRAEMESLHRMAYPDQG